MTTDKLLEKIQSLFLQRGGEEYHGENVSQLEHALQSAYFAVEEKADAEMVAAALLHDLGHLLSGLDEQAAERGIDDRHEDLGYRFLAKHFSPRVAEAVRLHVAAKRYLCATRQEYVLKLSLASIRSLELQGGPMSEEECGVFEQNPYYEDALKVRLWDDRAKIVGFQTPELAHYLPYLEKACVKQ